MGINEYKLTGDSIIYVSKYKIPVNKCRCFDEGTEFILTKIITPEQEYSCTQSDMAILKENVEYYPEHLIIPSALLFMLFDQIDISNYEIIKDSCFTDSIETIKVLADNEFDAVIKAIGSNLEKTRTLYDLDSYLKFWSDNGVKIKINKIAN